MKQTMKTKQAMKTLSTSLWILTIAALIVLPGCGGDPDPNDGDDVGTDDDDHPEEGPHGGKLIELGNEEYHAEIIHSDDKASVFLLDGSVKMGPSISEASLKLNLTHHGDAKQFVLDGVAQEGSEGEYSEFTSSDEELLGLLKEDDHLDVAVVVEIKGVMFRGTLAHSH